MMTSTQFIFLPGASGSTEFWQPVMQALPDYGSKKVIAYPGFGECLADPEIQNFNDLQHLVLSQIVEPSVLIAQSMGGIFAAQAALQKPELVRALVLVATSGGVDLSPFDVFDWRNAYQKAFSVPDWFVQHREYLDDELEKIECPVLLIWGDSDPISPVKVGQYLQSKLKNSELKIVPDGQHDLAKVHAHQLVEWLDDFIFQNMNECIKPSNCNNTVI